MTTPPALGIDNALLSLSRPGPPQVLPTFNLLGSSPDKHTPYHADAATRTRSPAPNSRGTGAPAGASLKRRPRRAPPGFAGGTSEQQPGPREGAHSHLPGSESPPARCLLLPGLEARGGGGGAGGKGGGTASDRE